MNIKWTKETITEIAKSCTTKLEFTKSYGGAYNAAKRLGIFDEICAHFHSSNTHWTNDLIFLEALKYTTRESFKLNSRGAYEAAVRKGFNKFSKHMNKVRKQWTIDSAFKEAKKYQYRGIFLNACSGAYSYLNKHNKLYEACSHMYNPKESIKWTEKAITKEAKKYATRNAFKRNSSTAYQSMLKLGLTSSICTHMKAPKCVKYTYEELLNEALKYNTKSEFKRNSYGLYQAACRHPRFEEMGLHMIDASRFSMFKPSILYYFGISFENTFVWKIGITNYSIEDRYYRRDINRMENILEIPFNSGAEAYNAEQTIMKLYKDFKYIGKTPFTDGTGITECFKQDISKEEFFISLRSMDTEGNPKE